MTTFRGGVFTPSELCRLAHLLDRRGAAVNAALTTMRGGQSLHLQFQNGCPLWSLSGGRAVSAEVAAILISDASVVPVGRALFDDMPGQIWRVIE